MKARITNIIYKNNDEESVSRCNVSSATFYDLQTHGKNALKNLLKQVELCIWGDIKDVKSIELEMGDKYSKTYQLVDLENY